MRIRGGIRREREDLKRGMAVGYGGGEGSVWKKGEEKERKRKSKNIYIFYYYSIGPIFDELRTVPKNYKK